MAYIIKEYEECSDCSGKGWILEYEYPIGDGRYISYTTSCVKCMGTGKINMKEISNAS